MSPKNNQSLEMMIKKRELLDNQIEAKKQSLATSIGTPFVAKFGSDFTPKQAALFASRIEVLGAEKALARLK